MENENLLNEMLDMPVFPLYILIPGYLDRFFYWHSCNGEKIELDGTYVIQTTTLFEGRQVTSIMSSESDNPDDWKCPHRYFWAAYDDENLLYLFSHVSEQMYVRICEYMPKLKVSLAQIRKELK